MNKNTGYTQWVRLPGYGVLGFWSFRPMRFRVLEFRFLRFGVFFPGYSKKHWPYAGDWARRRIRGIRHGQASGLRWTCFTQKYDYVKTIRGQQSSFQFRPPWAVPIQINSDISIKWACTRQSPVAPETIEVYHASIMSWWSSWRFISPFLSRFLG